MVKGLHGLKMRMFTYIVGQISSNIHSSIIKLTGTEDTNLGGIPRPLSRGDLTRAEVGQVAAASRGAEDGSEDIGLWNPTEQILASSRHRCAWKKI